MAQNNRGNGGNNRQDDRQAPLQNNDAESLGERLNAVLRALDLRGEELAHVLPKDVTLDAFLANVNQALRNNPKLLRCTFPSIVDACVKAAYDGLRIDGKEAAIIDAEDNYKDGTVWKKRSVARYMPMVFGLIKQILQTGAALSVKAVIVYKRETTEINPIDGKPHFMLLEGTNPGIHHSPILFGDKGEMVGVYAVAEIQAGVFKHEWMDKVAVLDVMEVSKTDKVWNRWPTEMWKKSVIRRLRKSLAGTSLIRDMEAQQMFPQFDRTAPHPQLAGVPHFSAPAGARPMRGMIDDQRGTGSGVPLDLGRDGEGVEMDRGEAEDRENAREQQQSQNASREQQREPEVQLPENEQAWGIWGVDLEAKIEAAKTTEEVDQIWRDAAPITKHAKKAVRDRLTSKVTERNTNFAMDAAGAGDGDGE
jgi:phage RecT family recombinase